MTPRQSELRAFIKAHIGLHGFCPTEAEMRAALDKSESRVEQLLSQLVASGGIIRLARGVYAVPDLPPGDNIRPPRATAPQLGALLATFEKMRHRA